MSRLFGPVRQNGYVVRDIDSALAHWSNVIGVGPWFYVERAPIRGFSYRGRTHEIHLSIALANAGPLQLELIQQKNDAPSLYRDFLDAGNEGLQHIAFWTETFRADRERALAAGFTVGHEGRIGDFGPFVYFDSSAHPGTVVELSDVSGPKMKLFEQIRAASEDWDGTDPVRPFPTDVA